MGEYSRLPSYVVPNHYSLFLAPNLESCTFSGRVSINLTLHQTVSEIAINANSFETVTVDSLVRVNPAGVKPVKEASLGQSEAQVDRKRELEPDDPEHTSATIVPRKRPRKACPGRFKRPEDKEEEEEDSEDEYKSRPLEKSKEEVDKETVEDEKTGSSLVAEEESRRDSESSEKETGGSGVVLKEESRRDSESSEKETGGSSLVGKEESRRDSKSSEKETTDTENLKPSSSSSVAKEKKGLVLLRSEWINSDDESSSSNDEPAGFTDLKAGGDDERISVRSSPGSSEAEDEVDVVDSESEAGSAGGAEVREAEEGPHLVEDSEEEDLVMQIDGGYEEEDEGSEAGEADCDKSEAAIIPSEDQDCAVPVESYEFLRASEVVLIRLVDPALPGSYRLTLTFRGNLDDSMRGFYRTKHTVSGEERWGAACHFEATGARKCFPCFDQPEFRSTYSISVVRPAPEVEVLSNMPPVNSRPLDPKTDITNDSSSNGCSVVEFGVTPALPSYLVCVVLGYYDLLTRRTEDGVVVSVHTPRGEVRQGEFAMEVATKSLTFYKEFFGVGYTLPKMDLVAVPDFYIGAMENWGLLTFRETALLFHPSDSTLARRQYVAILVAHEIAHQWFGNLVSINWWDQLWLKEGFATWISFLAVDKLFPEFDMWSDFLTKERLIALDLDVLQSSHPIEVPGGVTHPAQIDEIFDAISYSKGASVINMLFSWVGEERFREGLRRYLQLYQGSNTATEQLWSALDSSCEGPRVGEVLDDWTKQQGFPWIAVRIGTDGRCYIKQEVECNKPRWRVPLHVRTSTNRSIHLLLDKEQEEEEVVSLEAGETWCIVNSGQAAFCRVNYSWSTLQAIGGHLAELGVRDRLGILSDLSSSVLCGTGKVEHLLQALDWWRGETNWSVLEALLDTITKLETLVEGTAAWQPFLQLVYRILEPSLEELGVEAREGEGQGNHTLARAALIDTLGRLGHTLTAGEAWHLWRRELGGHAHINKDIRGAVYRTVARTGGRLELETLRRLYLAADRAETRRLLLSAIAAFTDPELVRDDILHWIASDAVKLQDRVFGLAALASGGPDNRALTWQYFTREFPGKLSKLYTSGCLLTNLVKGVTRHFTLASEADSVENFFTKVHPLPAAHRTVQQVVEDIRGADIRRLENLPRILQFFTAALSSASNITSHNG